MTNADPQSTAVHLSSDLHDLCISQKRSQTTSVLSPYFVPFKKKKSKHPTNESPATKKTSKRARTKTGRSKHLPLWPMFAELSLLTLAHLNCHDPGLRLVSVWRSAVIQKSVEKKAIVPILHQLDSTSQDEHSSHLALAANFHRLPKDQQRQNKRFVSTSVWSPLASKKAVNTSSLLCPTVFFEGSTPNSPSLSLHSLCNSCIPSHVSPLSRPLPS